MLQLDPYQDMLTLPRDRRSELEGYVRGQSDWFHSFAFDSGLRTPGRDPSAKKLHHLCLPRDMSGLSVIDIGAFEGYFSFHCEQRGADRVVAADKFVWDWPGATARPNYEAVHRALGSKVEDLSVSVEDMPGVLDGETFDVVLFPGVLYHAPNMVEYLEAVAAVTKNVCVLETLFDCLDEGGARSALYSPAEMNGDSSNWWGPNLRATTVMLERVGFRHVEFVNMWDVNTRSQLTGDAWDGPIKSGRGVLHAYK